MLSRLDLFPKRQETVLQRSSGRGLLSFIVYVVILGVFVSETRDFLGPLELVQSIQADTRLHSGQIPVNFDLEFPGLTCDSFGLDAVDTAGFAQLSVADITRHRMLDSRYERDTGKLSVVDPQRHGCRIEGTLNVNSVKGEFHVAFGKQSTMESAHQGAGHAAPQHIHRFQMRELQTFNASHRIRHLSFGDWSNNALDGRQRYSSNNQTFRYLYFIEIVPTRYTFANGTEHLTNQYSFTFHEIEVNIRASRFWQPGVYFKYEISPYVVLIEEKRRRVLDYVVALCALIGGAFACGKLAVAIVDGIATGSVIKKLSV